MAASPPTDAPPLRPGVLLLIGTVAGVYSGLFGVGGGSVMVPLLILLLAFDPREATATSLAAITVIATAGTVTHALYGNVAWAPAFVVAVPAVVGAFIGTTLQQRVPREWLTVGLAILLVVGAADLLGSGDASASFVGPAGSASGLDVEYPVILAVAGFAAGVLGGMVGIGGGILVVPILLATDNADARTAVATSLAAMIPMSISAAARHHHYGNLRLRQGLILGVLGIVGAAAGASLAEVLPQSVLRIAFGLLMLAIAAQMVTGVVRAKKSGAG